VEGAVPAFITLFKYTPLGLATIKESPNRINKNRALVEKLDGRIIGIWLTMGEYDLVAVSEAPNAEVAAQVAMMECGTGTVTSQTMQAFAEEEFAGIVARIP
jgi:uncharacterized protein with GYD domain